MGQLDFFSEVAWIHHILLMLFLWEGISQVVNKQFTINFQI